MHYAIRRLPLVFILCAGLAQSASTIESPVADAAMNGDRSAVRLLVEKKADVNAPQADGATALQWAAYRDDLELAGVLIAAGANPKIPNREGATAMQLACQRGSAESSAQARRRCECQGVPARHYRSDVGRGTEA